MTPKEILDGNKLIAEFMGMEYEPAKEVYDTAVQEPPFNQSERWLSLNGNITAIHYKLYYHENWSWLMPVVQKIEGLSFQFASYNAPHKCNVRISQGYIEIEGAGQKIFRNTSVEGSKINALWLAVVDFIEWNNKNEFMLANKLSDQDMINDNKPMDI